MKSWFYSAYGTELGPFTSDELIELAKSQQIAADDQIKLGVDGKWRKAGAYKQLQPYFTSTGAIATAGSSSDIVTRSSDQVTAIPAQDSAKPLLSKTTQLVNVADTKPDLPTTPNDNVGGDDVLLQTLADILAARKIPSFVRVGMTNNQGVITVYGNVASKGERLLLLHLLQKTPGVKSINDGLVVSTKSTPEKRVAPSPKQQSPTLKAVTPAPKPVTRREPIKISFNFLESVKRVHLVYGVVGLVVMGAATLVVQASTSKNQLAVYPANGTLALNGEPIPGATVILNPVSRPKEFRNVQSRGVVQADGSFQISTYGNGDGAPLGDYAVTVVYCKPIIVDGDPGFGPNLTPAMYASPETSPLKATIVKGKNQLAALQLIGPETNAAAN